MPRTVRGRQDPFQLLASRATTPLPPPVPHRGHELAGGQSQDRQKPEADLRFQ